MLPVAQAVPVAQAYVPPSEHDVAPVVVVAPSPQELARRIADEIELTRTRIARRTRERRAEYRAQKEQDAAAY